MTRHDVTMNAHDEIKKRLRTQAETGQIRVSLHGHEEMVEEEITYEEICDVLCRGDVLENYPEYQRGPCCLMCGQTSANDFCMSFAPHR